MTILITNFIGRIRDARYLPSISRMASRQEFKRAND